MPLYATSVYGVSVLQSGLIMTPRSIGVIISSVIFSFYVMKLGYRRPLIFGTLGIMIGVVAMALEPGRINVAGISLSPVLLLTIIALFIGFASGVVGPAGNNACIDLAPENAASITGLLQMSTRIGSVICISISTLVLQQSKSMEHGFYAGLWWSWFDFVTLNAFDISHACQTKGTITPFPKEANTTALTVSPAPLILPQWLP